MSFFSLSCGRLAWPDASPKSKKTKPHISSAERIGRNVDVVPDTSVRGRKVMAVDAVPLPFPVAKRAYKSRRDALLVVPFTGFPMSTLSDDRFLSSP